jgi:hypothetical protein
MIPFYMIPFYMIPFYMIHRRSKAAVLLTFCLVGAGGQSVGGAQRRAVGSEPTRRVARRARAALDGLVVGWCMPAD